MLLCVLDFDAGDWGEKVTHFLSYSFIKSGGSDDAVAFQQVIADFDALASGMLEDRPIARDGRRTWKLVLLIAKADEEARCNVFGLPHWGSDDCCPECLCNRSLESRPYTDLRGAAAWRATEDMPFEMFRARLRQPPHPLAASGYCCSRWCFSWT